LPVKLPEAISVAISEAAWVAWLAAFWAALVASANASGVIAALKLFKAAKVALCTSRP